MFPVVIATGEPSDLAIALRGIAVAALGMALTTRMEHEARVAGYVRP